MKKFLGLALAVVIPAGSCFLLVPKPNEPPEATPEDAGFYIPSTLDDGGLSLHPRDAGPRDAATAEAPDSNFVTASSSGAAPPSGSGSSGAVSAPASTGTAGTSNAGDASVAQLPDAAQPPDAAGPVDAGFGQVSFTVDSTQSLFYVQVYKDTTTTLASQAHDHVIRANVVTGTVRYDADHPTTCAVSITLPVADLMNDEPHMRMLVGYSANLSTSDREAVNTHMRESSQLDEGNHATMSFTSTSCSGGGGLDGTLQVTGNLNIRGVDRSITAAMLFITDGDQVRARGTFTALQTDFGFSPYSAFFGAVRNLNEMRFTLDVVAVR